MIYWHNTTKGISYETDLDSFINRCDPEDTILVSTTKNKELYDLSKRDIDKKFIFVRNRFLLAMLEKYLEE